MTALEIREASNSDLPALLELYMQLHDNPMPEINEKLKTLWTSILAQPDHHVLVGIEDQRLVCSCVLIVVPNLTRSQRPYALIENVITDQAYRNRGHATSILQFAKNIAQHENCYKIMLMTSSKQESTLRFYERAGYNRQDKTAFIQWL